MSKKNTLKICIIGMPGSGKSTIGRILSKKLNYKFFDTDESIENETKSKINDIFTNKGEVYFRELETKILNKLIKIDKIVISTGGGIILKNKNPNLILCSTAIRAKETLGHLISLNKESPTLYDESLYLAEPKKITDCIIKNASDEETILLVAHNPGIHELTLNLSENNSHVNLEEGYPTASISIISLGNDDWHDLGSKKLELIKFIRPRDLNN